MIFLTIYIAVFGLVIGCFLNVCIYRIPTNHSIINPPSHCTSCGTRLRPLDLVPVFSYVFLRGKCRYCGERVSARYPIVECLTAAVFVLLYFRFSLTIEFLAATFFACILICVAFIDFDFKIIPNGLVIAGLVVGVALCVYNLFYPVSMYGDRVWYNPLLGIICGSGVLFLISIVGSLVYKTEDAMGMGDVKLFVVVGLFLGWRLTIIAFMVAVIFAAIISLALILFKRLNKKSTVPFGPFIALGAFIAMTYGWNIIDFYIGFLPK